MAAGFPQRSLCPCFSTPASGTLPFKTKPFPTHTQGAPSGKLSMLRNVVKPVTHKTQTAPFPPSPSGIHKCKRERERIKKRKKKGRKCPGGQGKTTKQPKQLGARRHTPVSWKPLATKHDANSLKVTVKDSSKRRVRKKNKKKTTRFPGVANFGNAIVSWSPATPSFYQISPRGFPLPNGRHLTLAASLSKSITCSSFTLPVVKSCSTNLATILGRPRDGGKTNHPNSILVRTTENMVYRDWKILVWKEIRKNIGGKKKRNRRYTLCCFLTIALMLFTCLKIPVTGL